MASCTLLVEGEKLSQLHLNKLYQLLILHSVHLVEEADDVGYTNLPRSQSTFSRKRPQDLL